MGQFVQIALARGQISLQRDADITSDNKLIAMTDSDGLHLFELGSLRERILPTGDCDGVRLSPTGHLAAITLRQRDSSLPAALVRIWDYQTGNEVRSIAFTNGFEFMDWSSNGKNLYTQTEWGSLIVWDIDSGTSKSNGVPCSGGQVVAVSPDGRDVVRNDFRGELSVVGVEARRVLASSGFPVNRTRAWFSVDGRWFAASEPDGQIVVWEWATSKKVGTLRGHSDFVWSICFLPHRNRIVSLGNDRTVRLWEFGKMSNTSALAFHLGTRPDDVRASSAMQFSPSGEIVTLPTYTSTTNSETLLWNLGERKGKA